MPPESGPPPLEHSTMLSLPPFLSLREIDISDTSCRYPATAKLKKYHFEMGDLLSAAAEAAAAGRRGAVACV